MCWLSKMGGLVVQNPILMHYSNCATLTSIILKYNLAAPDYTAAHIHIHAHRQRACAQDIVLLSSTAACSEPMWMAAQRAVG